MAFSKNKAFGLDISDAMLKLVWLDQEGHIRSYNSVPLEKETMEDGRIKNPALFKKSLRALIDGAKGEKVATPWVVASLPETKVFVKTVTMPKEDEKRGAERFVFARVGEHIPLPVEDVYVSWHDSGYGREKRDGRRLTIAAVPRDIVDEYYARLREAGLKVEGLQAESTALTAALVKGWPTPVVAKGGSGSVLVDFRHDHAAIVLVDDGSILLSMAVRSADVSIDAFIARVEEKIELGNAWYERESGARFKSVTVIGHNEFQERLFSDLRAKKAYGVEIGNGYDNLCSEKGVGHEIYRLPNSFTTAIGLALSSR